MPRLFYPPLAEPGVYIKPKGIKEDIRAEYISSDVRNLYMELSSLKKSQSAN